MPRRSHRFVDYLCHSLYLYVDRETIFFFLVICIYVLSLDIFLLKFWGGEKRIGMSHVKYEWDMSRIYMSRITRMNESCHTHTGACGGEALAVLSAISLNEWVRSHVWMSLVTRMNESCHTLVSHTTHIDQSWHPHEWVKPYVWMSVATRLNEPCRAHGSVMSCHTHDSIMSHT